MVNVQNDCCAICKKHRVKNGKRLAVYYCHKTGKVRGSLCGACNKMLGVLNDDPKLLYAAVAYLQKESPLVIADSLDYSI